MQNQLKYKKIVYFVPPPEFFLSSFGEIRELHLISNVGRQLRGEIVIKLPTNTVEVVQQFSRQNHVTRLWSANIGSVICHHQHPVFVRHSYGLTEKGPTQT